MRPVRLLVPLAVAAATLPGCGSDEPPLPKEAPRVFLDRAELPGSAKVDAEFEVDGGAVRLPVGFTGELEGPYEVEPGGEVGMDLDFELEVEGLGAEGSIVVTGDTLYLVLFGENYRQPLGDSTVDSAAVDPADATSNASYAGVEEVGGADTARIEAEARVEVPSPLSPPGAEADLTVPELKGDVVAWVGLDDGLLRRLSFEARGLSLEMELDDLGESFEFKPPEGGGFRPLSDLVERFGDLV